MLRLLLFVGAVAMAALARAQGDPFCLQAQHWIATTALQPELVQYQAFEPFVESKASLDPFRIHQYYSNPLPGDGSLHRVLSCKLKSAESLNRAFGDPDPVAGGNTGCDFVTEQLLQRTLARLSAAQRRLGPEDFVVAEEVVTHMGPSWLKPWPFEAITATGDGRWRLNSRALRVPDAWYIPLPARIKGVYYCHLIAPEYLEALVSGAVAPPASGNNKE